MKGAVHPPLARSAQNAVDGATNGRDESSGPATALNEMTPADEKFVNLYSGGKTEREARGSKAKNSTKWHHRRKRKRCELEGHLTRLPPLSENAPGRPSSSLEEDGRKQSTRPRGRRASRWIPTRELIQSTKGERDVHQPADLGAGRIALIKAGVYCWTKVKTVKVKINDKDAWRKPRRIRAICSKDIRPLVESIRELWSRGVKVTLPFDFFEKENPPLSKGIFTSPDLRGTLGILLYTSSAENPCLWVHPSLPEWEEYLNKVASELEPFLHAHVEAVIAGEMSGCEVPGYDLVVPSRIVDNQRH